MNVVYMAGAWTAGIMVGFVLAAMLSANEDRSDLEESFERERIRREDRHV